MTTYETGVRAFCEITKGHQINQVKEVTWHLVSGDIFDTTATHIVIKLW